MVHHDMPYRSPPPVPQPQTRFERLLERALEYAYWLSYPCPVMRTLITMVFLVGIVLLCSFSGLTAALPRLLP